MGYIAFITLIILFIVALIVCFSSDSKINSKTILDKVHVDTTLTVLLGIIGGIGSNLFSKDSLNGFEIVALVLCSFMVWCINSKRCKSVNEEENKLK